MAALVGHDSRQYSWWWVSHISPKNSKWLQENLNDMDTKVTAMIKLINEDADSFARRAEMYYKKRPELMKLVEEFYRAYRALAERYDQATGALRQAHRTISEAFPNQMPSMSDESPSSLGQEMELHTPEMPTFTRAPFDSDDLQKDGVGVSPQHFSSKRNGTHPDETSSLPNEKGVKQFNDLSLSSENAPHAIFDGKVRKCLRFESPEVKGNEDISNEMVNLQQEISRLLAGSQNMKQQILSESERANKAESEIQSLKDTVLQLNCEKGTSLLQYNQSTERLSTLESELSKAQADLKRLTDEMSTEVEKVKSAETRNSEILSMLEAMDQKVKMQQQELEQKHKELEGFQEEHEKRLQAENALLSEGKERAQSQEEVQRLTIEIKMANEKLNELTQTKMDLENAVCELKNEVKSLTKQNRSSELLIQELRDEINALKDSKNEFQSEIQSLMSTISQLNTEKDSALLQHQKSVKRVSVLESELFKLQSDLDEIEQKVQMLMQDLEQKREEAGSVHAQLQDECLKRTQTEATLLTAENLHSQLQEDVEKLTQDLDRSTKKLSELENDKLDLENTSRELKNNILDLSSEKDAALLQQQRSLEKVSDLELKLSETQLELEKSEQKMQLLELEIAQKSESVGSLKLSLKNEADKRVQAETSVMSVEKMYSHSQEEMSRLHLEIEKLNGKLNELENSSSELKNTILLLNTEKDASLLKNQQSAVRVSDLESELSKFQAEMEKVEGKVEMMEQELKHKKEEVVSLQSSLQDESQKCIEGEAALLSLKNLHSDSQEEVHRLALEIEKLMGKLSRVENSKMDLENIITKHTEDIHILHEQNLTTELMIKDLHRELDTLKELNVKLETEVGLHIGEKESLQRDFACQREEKENLEGIHHALADEMDALKSSAATNQKFIEELQIMNLKLKEACAKNEVEKALLSEKVQEVEKLSEEYSLLENSLSDANAEIDELREEIKVLGASESSLKDVVSSHVSEKAVLASELEKMELMIKDLHRELDTLKELNVKLETEVGLHIGEKESLQRDFACQREDKENLEGMHHALADEMDALKSSAATNQKFIEELQIMNLKLKEACAKNEVEKALLSEKVQEVEKLSEEYSLLENSLSDANAEIDELREEIKVLGASESSLKDVVSSHVSKKAVLASELEKMELMIKDLHRELDTLKELNVKLETEVGLHISEKESLQRDFACQREEKENLEGMHHSLADEMDALKSSAATNQKFIEELQIMNLKLKEACAKNEVEKAFLSEKVLEVDKLSEEYSLLENSLSDANAEIDALREEIKVLEASESSLKDVVSSHVSEKAVLASELEKMELMIKDLHRELDTLKELNVKLETEVGLHIGEKESLQRDFACQREEKENLEGMHHALADEMNALKSSAATNQKFIEELQFMNLKLKEACAKNEVEKVLLSEKVQEAEKLSEEYSLLENSLSDANAEIDALREEIKVLEASESSLKDVVSSHVSEKAVLASELQNLGKSFTNISEKNSILDTTLSNMKAELEELRTKLKDSEETCQAHLANNSALSAEKSNVFSQLESITVVMKALEGKHADLENKHSSLSIEKDLAYDQVKEVLGQLRIKNEEYEAAVKSHQMEVNSFKEQISSLQEKRHYMDEMLEKEEQRNMSASISVVILESILADVQDKNIDLFSKCQKYAEANHTTGMLILQLQDEARYHEEERKTLLMCTEKLREGISQHMKVLNIYKDLGPANIAQDKILLQTVSDETFNILKLKEESEDANRLMYTELLVLATVLLQVGTELRDLHLQKCALEKEVESGAAEFLSLRNKNKQILECNEQLRQGLKKGSEREELLKTEVLVLQEKLSYLSESYQTSRDEIANLTEKNESLSKEYQSLIEKYNTLEYENGTFLAECMRLEHLSLFLRGHNNEVASALVSLTDEMDLLSLIKGELDCKVQVLSRRTMMLESENKHLKEYSVSLVEILGTRLVLSEFDLNTSKSFCQELAFEFESIMAQLLQKGDELLEAEERVQFLQEKNRELCGVVGVLQVAVEGAEVVKGELDKKIATLTEEGTTKDDEILLLRRANETFQVEANILKEKADSLTSAHECMSKEVEQNEREFVVLMGDAIISSVNAAVYEEKALKLMMEGKAMEISAIAQKVLLMKEISSRGAHIEHLHKKVTGMQEENAELKAELSTHLALVASLSDHVNVLEEDILSLSKSYSTEGKEEAVQVPCMQEGNHATESHSPDGTPELHWLIARIEALRVVILNAKDRQDQELTESAAKMAAAHIEIQELKARGGSRMEAREIYSDNEKQKDVDGSKGKLVQMMKDIELDQISTCPPYGTGAALYPLGNGANAELDDEMLQLWEAAERNCKNPTAKSSSSEHDIQAVEEVKSEHPSSELARGRDLGINKLDMSIASVEPHEVWSKNVLEKLTSDAHRLLSMQASIEELKRKMGGPSKGKSPMNSECNSVSTQLIETEGYVLEQINFNNKLTKKAENYPALSDSMNAEREGYSSRRKISEQVQKGSENVARLELELQKIQYVFLKLEEEHEYRRLKVSEKSTRVLLRDYLYGRKDNSGGGQKKKKRVPFCGCVRPKSRTET